MSVMSNEPISQTSSRRAPTVVIPREHESMQRKDSPNKLYNINAETMMFKDYKPIQKRL